MLKPDGFTQESKWSKILKFIWNYVSDPSDLSVKNP